MRMRMNTNQTAIIIASDTARLALFQRVSAADPTFVSILCIKNLRPCPSVTPISRSPRKYHTLCRRSNCARNSSLDHIHRTDGIGLDPGPVIIKSLFFQFCLNF